MLKNKNNFLLLLASLVSVASIAQTNTIAPKPTTTNYMEVLMGIGECFDDGIKKSSTNF